MTTEATHWKLPEPPKVEREDYFDDDLVAKVNELRAETRAIGIIVGDREAAIRIRDELAQASTRVINEWQLVYDNGTKVWFITRPTQGRGRRLDALLDHYSADDKLWTAVVPCLG